jgi:hypothetical protein
MNDLVNMRIMWHVFGMQRGPVKQMEVMIKEMVQIAQENGGKNCEKGKLDSLSSYI